MRYLFILVILLTSCADDNWSQFYDYDLSELSEWQQEIFISKAQKWESIIGYHLFGFNGTTNTVQFIDISPHIGFAHSNGNISFQITWNWTPCSENSRHGGMFDDIAAHELGHVIGFGHSANPNDIMHDPPPICKF